MVFAVTEAEIQASCSSVNHARVPGEYTSSAWRKACDDISKFVIGWERNAQPKGDSKIETVTVPEPLKFRNPPAAPSPQPLLGLRLHIWLEKAIFSR